MTGHREPLVGETFVALSGHMMRRDPHRVIHLALCSCWSDGAALLRRARRFLGG
jgi:hypothetical protein